jgi:hypothetical protein
MRFYENILFLLSFYGSPLVQYHVHGADIKSPHPSRDLQHHGSTTNAVEDTQYLRGAGVLPAFAAHQEEQHEPPFRQEKEGPPTYEKQDNLTADLVTIVNSCGRVVSGTVEYATGLCSDDTYRIPPQQNWEATSRGACLVTKITAKVDGIWTAIPYESGIGTAFSQFAVIDLNANNNDKYQVTRRVS